MKIYTKTGDEGTTALFGFKRVQKDDIRIEAYGTIDELNSFIGLLNSSFQEATQNYFLSEVQKRLFTIGANLASDPDKKMITPDIKKCHGHYGSAVGTFKKFYFTRWRYSSCSSSHLQDDMPTSRKKSDHIK